MPDLCSAGTAQQAGQSQRSSEAWVVWQPYPSLTVDGWHNFSRAQPFRTAAVLPVLLPRVSSLAVEGGGVMLAPEHIQQLLIRHLRVARQAGQARSMGAPPQCWAPDQADTQKLTYCMWWWLLWSQAGAARRKAEEKGAVAAGAPLWDRRQAAPPRCAPCCPGTPAAHRQQA
jgi:hypothetical protein